MNSARRLYPKRKLEQGTVASMEHTDSDRELLWTDRTTVAEISR
jgi:hypothetical protein